LADITRTHSQAYQHDYRQSEQVLDLDMSGLGGGRSGEGVKRGYFADGKRRRGRQLGRVLASRYDEIVSQRLYAGNRQLHASLRPLVLEAEAVLKLDEFKRTHTLIRVDGGGGDTDQVNWLLGRDYLRLVRDVFTIPGRVQRDARGRVCAITLNQRAPYAAALVQAFASLLAVDGLWLNLGEI
ncbi:MAG: hypothetical protein ACYDBJ_23070, partial [Aggregatilineales bacterium]